jgi:hypothetical protein
MNMIEESFWAYLAGLVDGEGHLKIFRHYSKNPKVSCRGYELEPHITITSMSKPLLEKVQQTIGIGNINTHIDNTTTGGELAKYAYSLRFYANAQRIILPKIIPHLIHKKEIAEVLLHFLEYRKEKIYREEKEKGYLDFERKYWRAIYIAKPWLSPEYSRRKKKHEYVVDLLKG